jgi:tetratricopeptide (TPR) repeat protein
MQPKERDGERLRQLNDFASQLHIPTEGGQPSEIRAALAHVLAADSASGRRSLWVVDDVPSGLNSDALSQWLSPHASVPTLITTRDRSHSSLGRLIDVDVLSKDESFALLETHRHVEDSERQAARDLLDALGHHALAVEITGSYLADQRSVSFEQFLGELRDPSEDVLEQAAELADALPLDHSPSIVATLNGTVSQLSEPARDLLCLASCLAAAPIPRELIEAVFARLYAMESASFRRMKAAKETERFALSRRELTPADALSVHTLVARTARRHPDSKTRLEAIQAAAVASLTDMLRGMFSLGSILRQSHLITHAREMSASLKTTEEAMLLVMVASTDLNRGDLETAERLAGRAFDYFRAELGVESLETCCAGSGVAMVLLARGDIAGAHKILEAVVPVFERSLSPGDIFRVGAQLGLASAVAAQGELPLARQLAEAALSASADSNGLDHPLTLVAKTIVGHILRAQGDLTGTTRLQQEVIDARRQIADSLDVDGLTDEILMAQAKLGSGEIESAAPVIENAVEVFERELGEDSILTLNAKLLLLFLLGSRGDTSGARQLASRLIPRFRKVFGPNNPATLQARFTEALAFLLGGDSRTGLSMIEPLVPELEAVLGPNHSEVLSAKVSLAQVREDIGDADGARRILDVLIPAAEARLGPAHDVTLNGKACLAVCLRARGDLVGACEVWEEVAALREGLLGGDHPQVLEIRLFVAHSLIQLGQYERCRELLRQVIPLAEARLGSDHEDTLMFKECAKLCDADAAS